jgi:RNase P/RNase MRP subunit p29
MSFIIGEDVRIAGARDALLLGLKGKVVLESMHTLTLKTAQSKVILPKIGTALELASGEILIGDDLEGRLEDRIAAARSTRRGERRRR